jgi:hypothetical protein
VGIRRFVRATVRILSPALTALIWVPVAAPQNNNSGAIAGLVVTEPGRDPMAEVEVYVTSLETGIVRSTKTLSNGRYYKGFLPPGRYLVDARRAGFENLSGAFGPITVSLDYIKPIGVPPFFLRRKGAAALTESRGQLRRPPEIASLWIPTVAFASVGSSFEPSTPVRYALPRKAGIPPNGAGPRSTAQASTLPAGSGPPQQTPFPPPSRLEPPEVHMANTLNVMRSANFDELQLTSLPLPGIRSFDTLALVVAGVTDPPQALADLAGPGIGAGVGTAGQFSVNGMRSRANNFTLDGSDNNDQDIAVRRQGFLSLLPQSVESIKEFQISTLLWDAELGRNLGAQVNAVTKSGNNQIHGQAYGFFTDDRLNARNPFDLTGGPSEGKDSLTRTQAGVAVALPLARNRSHVFASFEHQQVNASTEQHFATPSQLERRFQGLDRFKVVTSPLAVNNEIDYETSAGATPLGLNLFSLYPLPNNLGGPYGANTFTRVLPASGQGDVFSVKLTYQLDNWHAVSARTNFTEDSRVLPSVRRALDSTIDSRTRFQNVSLILDSTISSTVLNQARFSFGRTRLEFAEHSGSPLSRAVEQRHGVSAFLKDGRPVPSTITVNASTGPFGQLLIRPYSAVGLDPVLFPQGRANNTFQFANSTSRASARHTMRFGADIRFVQFNSRQDRNFRPLIEVNPGTLEIVDQDDPSKNAKRFLGASQFASIGQVSSILQTITVGPPNSEIGLRFGEINFSLIDNWRIRPNLLLDWSVRYEYNTVPREVNDRIEDAIGLRDLPTAGSSQFDSAAATAAFRGAVEALRRALGGRSTIYDSDGNNVGPHFGFAWDPGRKGRTAVRGGYGIYFDAILGGVVSQSRNVFPTEIPFLSDATYFGYDGLNANNPRFYAIARPGKNACSAAGDCLAYFLEGSNQLGGGRGDVVALVGSLFDASRQAGGLSFTLPERQLRTPYVQQWQLSFEREVFPDTLISVAYVGTRGTKLTRLVLPNGGPNITPAQTLTYKRGATPTVSFDIGERSSGNQVAIPRPEPALGAYQVFQNSAASAYHALQVEVRKRLSRGFTATGAFTWSHALDDVSDVFETAGAPLVAQNRSNLRAERGDAAFDVRRRVASSIVWEIPTSKRLRRGPALALQGWQLASIFQARSGQPFTVNVPFDANGDGNLSDRPSTAGGLVVFRGHGSRRVGLADGRTPNDFYVVGTDGIIGRNAFRGDGLVNLDIALNRRFSLGENRSLNVRIELFNAFNRSHFGTPLRTIGEPEFGSAVNTVAPARIVQVALKLYF